MERERNTQLKKGHYGKITLTLKSQMDSRGITNRVLSNKSGISYPVLERLYRGEDVRFIRTDLLAKICYALDCEIVDIMSLHRQKKEEK